MCCLLVTIIMALSSRTFRQLQQEGALCDVVISVHNQELFRAHRVILCSCSSYFRHVFCSDPSLTVLSFPHLPPGIMRDIMDFAYVGVVEVMEENISDLLAASQLFSIRGVSDACFLFLERRLSVATCLATWVSACRHGGSALRQKAGLYVLQHFQEVALSSLDFLQLTPQQLVGFIQRDEVNVRREDAVVDAVLRWIGHAPQERGGHMTLLLSKVRLVEASPDYLLGTLITNSLVAADPVCVDMVNDALETMNQSNLGKPLPCSRLPPTVLLVVGTWSKDHPTASMEVYNVRADQWSRLTMGEETPRMFYGSVCLDGSVYFVGGMDGREFLSSVRRLDLLTRTWQEVGSMHLARCYLAAVALDGLVYAIGGCGARGFPDHSDTAERFDPDANQWTMITSMNHRRIDFNATTLHGKIYVYGGFDRGDRLSSAESYDPQTDQWTLISPMESAVNGVAVTAYNDLVYVVGGFDGVRTLNRVAAYDPISDTWISKAPMMRPRNYFTAAVLEDRLYVFGGLRGQFGDIECYDGNTNTWRSIKQPAVASRTPSCYVVDRTPYFSSCWSNQGK